MSAITIIPDFENKTAKITGVASAGEKVEVTLKNCSTQNTSTLRLRVLFMKKLLAVFPVPNEDGTTDDAFTTSGDDLVCTLNLCTEQALKTFRRIPELDVMFILDDPATSVRQMYFRDFHTLLGWPQDVADTPIDLANYKDRIAALESEVADMNTQLSDAVGEIGQQLEGKVDKVEGKGLSTVDVTPETLAGFASAEALSRHVTDMELHLRSGERILWNGKVSTAELAGKQDIIVSGGYLYVPRGGDATPQRYHRAQVVFDGEINTLVLDISPEQFIFENGTFTEASE